MLMDTNGDTKMLLIKDLCGRLPYGVKIETKEGIQVFDIKWLAINMANIKNPYLPYLRPISSMTEEEDKDWQLYKSRIAESCDELLDERIAELHNWFNLHHFDYRGLIKKGLALPAPEDMYNF